MTFVSDMENYLNNIAFLDQLIKGYLNETD